MIKAFCGLFFIYYYFFDCQKAYVIHWVQLDRFSSVEKAYQDGMNRLEMLVSRVLDIDA